MVRASSENDDAAARARSTDSWTALKAEQTLGIRAAVRRDGKWWYSVNPLALYQEWLPAGGDYVRCRTDAH
jgi:hypothetical protein